MGKSRFLPRKSLSHEAAANAMNRLILDDDGLAAYDFRGDKSSITRITERHNQRRGRGFLVQQEAHPIGRQVETTNTLKIARLKNVAGGAQRDMLPTEKCATIRRPAIIFPRQKRRPAHLR